MFGKIHLTILLLSPLVWIATCKIFEECELYNELKKLGAKGRDLNTWVCIAFYESHLNTDAMNHLSGDHGLFQLSEIYWCNNGPTKGKLCKMTCNQLKDGDISDDFRCARRVFREHAGFQKNGFEAWTTYNDTCKKPEIADTFGSNCTP